ncbi:NUDIX domain-containing protein [Halosegnis rubeus]|uniref:NUDIX domain-containing protein n=1 Tax=Halosegnis rubeus TaxID=2212850 RepID=A0A5N5UAK2_9EURY|nr:NUDIX hydrolase [Halosegnis rubeus]KAB7514692.1 NUDIX domain-containing protein [Halosegnis rubeus]
MDDDLAWETTDSRIDYDCPGFAVREDAVTFPDGTTGEYHSVTEPDAVVILPFTPDGDVVAIEEWRQAVGRVNLGLPAGGLEPDDDDIVAGARRELREETGYETGRLESVATVEPANGLLDATHHHFVAYDCEPTADQSLDENESIRVTERDFETLHDRAVAGELRDGRAAVGVLRYAAAE